MTEDFSEYRIQQDIEQMDRMEGFTDGPLLKPEILKKYNVIHEDEAGNQKINCPRLAKLIMNNDYNHFIVIRDNQDILWFNGSFYEQGGRAIIEQRVNHYLDDQTSQHRKQEVVDFIRTHAYTDRNALEQPLNIINFRNGILDINTWELLEHDPIYTFQYELPVEFNKDAKCPNWEQFIADIIYPEDIPFIQEMCGYLLYRRYTWAILIILLGHGRNGKTTFLNVLSELIGEKNTKHIPIMTLAYDQHARAELYQMHANLCSEIGNREIKDTEALKQFTGTDIIHARQLYKEGFGYRNFAKLIFSCNVLPDIKDETLAMTERLAIIEFPNTFKRDDPECDPDIIDTLTTPDELSGILNWMVIGLKRLLKNKNFSAYKDFKNLTKYKRQCEDPIYKFIEQDLEKDENSTMQNSDLYTQYKKYCDKNKLTTLNDAWFGRKLMQFVPSDWNVTKGQKGKHTTKGLKIKGVDPSQTTF